MPDRRPATARTAPSAPFAEARGYAARPDAQQGREITGRKAEGAGVPGEAFHGGADLGRVIICGSGIDAQALAETLSRRPGTELVGVLVAEPAGMRSGVRQAEATVWVSGLRAGTAEDPAVGTPAGAHGGSAPGTHVEAPTEARAGSPVAMPRDARAGLPFNCPPGNPRTTRCGLPVTMPEGVAVDMRAGALAGASVVSLAGAGSGAGSETRAWSTDQSPKEVPPNTPEGTPLGLPMEDPTALRTVALAGGGTEGWTIRPAGGHSVPSGKAPTGSAVGATTGTASLEVPGVSAGIPAGTLTGATGPSTFAGAGADAPGPVGLSRDDQAEGARPVAALCTADSRAKVPDPARPVFDGPAGVAHPAAVHPAAVHPAATHGTAAHRAPSQSANAYASAGRHPEAAGNPGEHDSAVVGGGRASSAGPVLFALPMASLAGAGDFIAATRPDSAIFAMPDRTGPALTEFAARLSRAGIVPYAVPGYAALLDPDGIALRIRPIFPHRSETGAQGDGGPGRIGPDPAATPTSVSSAAPTPASAYLPASLSASTAAHHPEARQATFPRSSALHEDLQSVPDPAHQSGALSASASAIHRSLGPSSVSPSAIRPGSTRRTVRAFGSLPDTPSSSSGEPRSGRGYGGECVLVTGSGGTIGLELCRRLLTEGPRRIVLFDHAEYALDAALRELRVLAGPCGCDIAGVLGSVGDGPLVGRIIRRFGVDSILHAAAYKHVTVGEDHPEAMFRNNTLATATIARRARDEGVGRFVLVSTDKAVRPTGAMGASKRLAEIVVQDLAARSDGTVFSIVRFGNVIGSSGSVVERFIEQIAFGGPVTLTDARATRYFMTADEAAELVLAAGRTATGGEIFVLDMGRPHRIADIAGALIAASGRRAIPVVETGLRRGEKLHEDLSITPGERVSQTGPAARIFRVREPFPTAPDVAAMLRDLRVAVDAGAVPRILRIAAACAGIGAGDAAEGPVLTAAGAIADPGGRETDQSPPDPCSGATARGSRAPVSILSVPISTDPSFACLEFTALPLSPGSGRSVEFSVPDPGAP